MEKSYEVHILINDEMVPIKPTNGEPYRFKTKNGAFNHLIRPYSYESASRKHIVEVDKPHNIDLE